MKLDKEKLINIYVEYGTKFVNLNVNALNRYMRHLIVLKGLDPNVEPGFLFRKLMNKAVDTGIANKAYDEDFDLSWVRKKYFDVKDRLKKTDLNLKDFKKMTDISNLNDFDMSRSIMLNNIDLR